MPDFESKKILVTGGAGMIGSALVKALVSLGHEVTVVDNLWRGKMAYLKDDDGRYVIDIGKRFVKADLTVPGVLDDVLKNVDYVIHLADIVAGIRYVFSNQGSLFRTNFLINSNVIDAVRRRPVKGFVYVGTACSFPAERQTGVDAAPLKESEQYPANPESAYGWSKLMGEYETTLMEKEIGIPTCIPVLHNVYGTPADYSPDKGQVIPSLVRKAIQWPEERFIVWGSGRQGRAFVHVDDVVDALIKSLERGFGHGPIQIGPDRCITIQEIAETIVKVSGKPIEVEFDETKPEGDKGRCADYTKARTILGWEPQVSLEEGIRGLYEWISKDINKQDKVCRK